METLTIFRQENSDLLRTLGIAAIAAAARGIGGIVLSKALLAAKGMAVAHTALAAKGGGVAVLWHTVSRNALPLTTGAVGGAVGGGIASMQAMKRRVQNVRGALNEQVAQTVVAQNEAARLQSELTGAETHLKELQSRLDSLAARRPTSQNPLMQIQGIGPVFAQRLNAAGIYTLAELAAQTPDTLRDIIGTTRGGTMSDPEAWITAAQQLADLS